MSEGPFRRRGPRRIGENPSAEPASSAPPGSGRATPRASRRRRDLGPYLIGLTVIVLAVALIVLFVPPIALLDDDDATSQDDAAAQVAALNGDAAVTIRADRFSVMAPRQTQEVTGSTARPTPLQAHLIPYRRRDGFTCICAPGRRAVQ